jgi:hypothetical protein
MKNQAEREELLRKRYGELLTLRDLAVVLRYPSLAAIRKARSRGRLPLKLVQLPPRRGWFATPKAVAELLDALDHNSLDSAENAS